MLHIVNKSPTAAPALSSALRLSGKGALLLIEDAVYAATLGSPAEAELRKAQDRLKVYALAPDLEARGMADRVSDGVTLIDYDGFVDLVVEHSSCQSWL
ncbi:MAG: sulfurtransferase complex subunit TusB [Quisquiliibacterium sp.]